MAGLKRRPRGQYSRHVSLLVLPNNVSFYSTNVRGQHICTLTHKVK
jgi:hypothetical protein